MVLVCYYDKQFDNEHQKSLDLLEYSLKEINGIASPLANLTYTEHKKPLIPDCVFSISHSKGAVLLALKTNCEPSTDSFKTFTVSDCNPSSLGVDVESLFDKDVDSCLRLAKRKFFESEYQKLLACKTECECISLFCKMWTMKESYCKYTGVGIADALKFDTTKNHNDLNFHFEHISISDKAFLVCTCYNSI